MTNPVPGFPDESNTGVPAGTQLSTYDGPMNITTDGTVIENQVINGTLTVTASDVVIKDCVINFDSYYGVDAEGAKNITIENCTITGPGSSFDSNTAILGSGQFLNNNISETVTGLKLTDGSSTVEGNYIHDLNYKSPDMHSSALALQGGQDGVLIENNTLVAQDTSDVIIQDYFGSVNDVTVTHNLMLGDPGYDVYVEDRFSGNSTTNVSVTDNYIQKGYYGTFSVVGTDPTISGNVIFDQGTTPTQTIDWSGSTSTTTTTDPSTTTTTTTDPSTTTTSTTDPSTTTTDQATSTTSTTDPSTTTTDQHTTTTDTSTSTTDTSTSTTDPSTSTSTSTTDSSTSTTSTTDTSTSGSTTDSTSGSTSSDSFNFNNGHHYHHGWASSSTTTTATTADATTTSTTDPYATAVDSSTTDTSSTSDWCHHHHDASAYLADHFTM